MAIVLAPDRWVRTARTEEINSIQGQVIDGFFPSTINNMRSLRGVNVYFQNLIGQDKLGGTYTAQHSDGAVNSPLTMLGSHLDNFTYVFLFSITDNPSLTGARRMSGCNYHNYGIFRGHSLMCIDGSLALVFSGGASNLKTTLIAGPIEKNRLSVAVVSMKRNGSTYDASITYDNNPTVFGSGAYARAPLGWGGFDVFGNNDDTTSVIGTALRSYGLYYLDQPVTIDGAARLVKNPLSPFSARRLPYVDLGANSVSEKRPATPRQSYLLGTVQPGPKPSVAPLILRDWKRHGQPQVACDVDWNNPYTKDLVVAHSGLSSYIYGAYIAPAYVTCRQGKFFSRSVRGPIPGLFNVDFSDVLVEYSVFGTGATLGNMAVYGLSYWYANNDNRIIGLATPYANSSNFLQCTARLNSANNHEFGSGGGIYVNQGSVYQHRVKCVLPDNRTDFEGAYPNIGWLGFGAGTNGSLKSADPRGVMSIGSSSNTAYLCSNLLMWTSPVDRRDMRDIQQNPWQVFKPRQQRIFVGV